MNAEEIQCPFCGEFKAGLMELNLSASPAGSPEPWFVVCDRCRAVGPSCRTGEEALSKWNAVLTAVRGWHLVVEDCRQRIASKQTGGQS